MLLYYIIVLYNNIIQELNFLNFPPKIISSCIILLYYIIVLYNNIIQELNFFEFPAKNNQFLYYINREVVYIN
jgi:hypothetical protein